MQKVSKFEEKHTNPVQVNILVDSWVLNDRSFYQTWLSHYHLLWVIFGWFFLLVNKW